MSQPDRKNIGTSPTKHWIPMLRPRSRVIHSGPCWPPSSHVSLLVTEATELVEARSDRYQGRKCQMRLVRNPHKTHQHTNTITRHWDNKLKVKKILLQWKVLWWRFVITLKYLS